jgi:hypothetical protein
MKILSFSIVVLLVAWSYDAHAYLDPGTGSYVLQVAIAGIVSALFVLKIFWRRVVGFFSSLFKGKK